MAIEFDAAIFRSRFSEFSNEADYPTDELLLFWETVQCYFGESDYGRLTGNCRRHAMNLMLAHLLRLNQLIADGNTPAFVTQSTIGKVSVSVQPPPQTDDYRWWMSLTPYGQNLLGLLSTVSVGGFYVGGSAERSAFRKVGGRF